MTPQRLVQAIVLAWGWRRWLISFAAGALSALAMAPFNLWPILFLTFPALVWLIDGAGPDRWRGTIAAAATGWWFGFGYFVAGLYWIGYAFLVDAPTFGWLLPIAVIGLPALLAFFTAFGVALARILWTRGATRILALGVALTAAEWLRGHLLTGFPWNAFGYALASPLALAQSASIFGIWGLTLIAIVVFASPAALADEREETRWAWLPLVLAIAVLVGLGGFGALRLSRTPTRLVDGVHLRVMQPNVQQDIRFNYAAKQEVMKRYIALSDRAAGPQAPGMGEVTHLIWPEFAFPFFLAREPDALEQIAQLLRHGTVLITGAVRLAEPVNPTDPGVFNSIYVLNHDGSILGVYDKVHLVPFGEYLPFQRILENVSACGSSPKFAAGSSPGIAAGSSLSRAHRPRFRSSATRSSSRATRCRKVSGRDGSSMSPMTAGSASRAVPTSISSKRACAPSKRACPWSVPPTPAFPPSSIRSGGSSTRCRSARRE